MTWVELPDDTGFGIDNLPLGVFLGGGRVGFRHGVRIGDLVLDLFAMTDDLIHHRSTLDHFLVAGPGLWQDRREQVTEWLTDERNRVRVEPHLLPLDDVRMCRPIGVADYVDFYSSKAHAENVGRLFRLDGDPLPPNWRHLPIGYHGRAGTVEVSGTPVVRPCGQLGPPSDGLPPFGPTRRLDFEAEVGFVVGAPSEPGERVAVTDFAEHVFGVCLVDDWSARDLQAWEYVPLGPFLGKSFQTSMSPWIVPLAALEAARLPAPPRDTELLPYLRDDDARWGLDLTLEVRLNGEVVSRPLFRDMYWTPAQQLAHLTVNGAALSPGELFASGTVSGATPDRWGSLLELTADGTRPLTLADGTTRTFLEDGDVVTVTASAPGPGGSRIGFGDVTGTVLPAR
ncbi:fumarylacetoacetase [Blastococcus tunisiensis]|uniref:fumarylacetoacetase n=1 Tax=Blastococcus tunisiensis TaxID=1798228 RepID=A0A1I2M435_9ACTN|nr:fumarylacetoacetase [Blastococcus sp. DSM 46838]SFF85620.1 fumarylacetoacetate hydrolase [Blastococcus sp. DSM 46838]